MSATSATVARRVRGRAGLALLAGATFVATSMLAAACGGGSSGQAVASLASTTTSSATPSVPRPSASNAPSTAIAFVDCMRTHGVPAMPEPTVRRAGGHTSVSITMGAGIDPHSPVLAAALNDCKHLLPNSGAPARADSITPADREDYLRAASCMRTHGIPAFPDPTFANGEVAFTSRTPIDTSSPQFLSALRTCQKLIPAGLPYSATPGG